MRTYVVIALFLACVINAMSQQLSSQTRAQAIAEAFTKQKQMAKERAGGRKEKYKDIKSELLVKQNLSDYSATYEVAEMGYVINVQVGSDGQVQASGSDNGRQFRLENGKIEGALLTGSKIYQDGATEQFEGVFLKRTHRESPTDAGVTTLGLGVLLREHVQLSGHTVDKLFYQSK